MKNQIKPSLFILTLAVLGASTLVSCSHQQPSPDRSIASASTKDCWKHVKGEYQSYFDNVEECIEKQDHK